MALKIDNQKVLNDTVLKLKENAVMISDALNILAKEVNAVGEEREQWYKDLITKLNEGVLEKEFIKIFWQETYIVDKLEQISRILHLENTQNVLDIMDKLNEISVR